MNPLIWLALVFLQPKTIEIKPDPPPVVKELPEILQRIAECESGNRQFNTSGAVLRGKENPQDIGIFQINEFYHTSTSKDLNMDIYTEKGNTDYALWLYEHQGTRPWNWSKNCWSK